MAGQAGAAPAAQRAGLAFQALAEQMTKKSPGFGPDQVGLSAEQAMGRALTEDYTRLARRSHLAV
jgi:hypothetical protein